MGPFHLPIAIRPSLAISAVARSCFSFGSRVQLNVDLIDHGPRLIVGETQLPWCVDGAVRSTDIQSLTTNQ